MIRRAFVRSRIKQRIVFALLDLGSATLADLSREARAKPAHVRAALFGDGEAFAHGTALVRLRLVRAEATFVAETFRLTPLGSRVARAWRSEVTRANLGLPRRPHA